MQREPPICEVSWNGTTTSVPLHWNPQAYLIGTHGDWHGAWQVPFVRSDLVSEVINSSICEGDDEAECEDYDDMTVKWKIVGDLTPLEDES